MTKTKWLMVLSFVLASASMSTAWACEDHEDTALQTCKVTDPTQTPLNVRQAPMGKKIGTLKNGLTVQVMEHGEDSKGQPWVLIRDAKTHKKLGWVIREFVSCSSQIAH